MQEGYVNVVALSLSQDITRIVFLYCNSTTVSMSCVLYTEQ